MTRVAPLLLAIYGIGALDSFAHLQTVSTPLVITEVGIGPVTRSIPADLKEIAKLFPQFTVARGVEYSEGDAFPVIRVIDGRTEVFRIVPIGEPGPGAKIYRIVVESNRVVFAGKTRVGSSFSEIFGNSVPNHCGMGAEESHENVICDAVPSGRIRFEFSGGSDRNDGLMPSPSVLMKWRLTAMWVDLTTSAGRQ